MRPSTRAALAAAAALTSGLAALPALFGQEPVQVRDAQQLEQEARWLLHLATDRPSFRPGETLHLRGLLLHGLTRRPHPAGELGCEIEIRSPRGDAVLKSRASIDGAVLGLAWPIPADAAGGVWTLSARPEDGTPAAEQTFEVRSYRLPRLKTELEFLRKAYGPGDEVQATLAVTRAEGGAPAGARATCMARVDGAEVSRQVLSLDAAGKLLVSFRLPASIDTPDATLAIVIQDGGVQETAARTIPVVLNKLRLATYPEGGDLVAGLPARVYLEARTLTDDPADVRGRVLDAAGQEVARFASEHEGRGRFAFTPAAGARYELVIDEPAGVVERFPLPAVQADGALLTCLDDRVAAQAPLRVRVAGTRPGQGQLVVSVRDRAIATQAVELGREPREVDVALPPFAAGVLRVTLHDPNGAPRAERLAFRVPRADLQVLLSLAPGHTAPGEALRLRVETRDAEGHPVDALVALALVDDATLQRQVRRERAPRLPAQVLLGSEVRELRDAEVYLDELERGPLATDLLLGTQGWRRFACVRPDAFLAAHGDLARRVLALRDEQRVRLQEQARRLRRMAREADGGWDEERAAGGAPGMPRPAAAMPPAPPGGQQLGGEGRAMAGAPEQNEVGAPPAEPAPMAQGKAMPAREALRDRDGMRLRADDAMEPWAGEEPEAQLAFVREFAWKRAAGAAGRTEFPETLYWNAGVRTGADGVHEVALLLADSITTFHAFADAVGSAGALAWAEAQVEVRRPLYLEPKLPLEVSGGDLVQIPVAVVNGTRDPLQASLSVSAAGQPLMLLGGAASHVPLAPDGRERRIVGLQVGDGRGALSFGVSARAGARSDEVTRVLQVVPRGFPIDHAWGGQVQAGQPLRRTVVLPEGVTPGSLEARAALHPTPLAALSEALAALLQEPCGCFEQTSSSNYPNVMAMRYFRSHQGTDPALVARTGELLAKGYQRLVSYECKEKGYEWFGGDPGHEALTAYGLLEFTDMAAVMPVDAGMLQRTRAWLLARRDGKGGFKRNPQALDSFGGAPQDVTDAYITWALVECGERGVDPEVEAVVRGALASGDSYVLALAANILLARGDAGRAKDLLDKLVQAQTAEGAVDGARTSITRSSGESLRIEATALTALAWLRSPDHTGPLEKGMRWLLEQCKGGRFGSTQATILALRAVIAYDQARARPRRAGVAELLVNGQVVQEARFAADAEGAIVLSGFERALRVGENAVELRMQDGTALPASVVVRYRAETPASSPATQVELETALAETELTEGEATEVEVTVRSRAAAEGLPMTVAIVGLPGGLEVRAERLEELKRAGAFDFVETRGREVILYWRALPPGAVKKVVLSAVAAVPGKYTGPASRAYLYYGDEHKHWVPGLQVTIAPR